MTATRMLLAALGSLPLVLVQAPAFAEKPTAPKSRVESDDGLLVLRGVVRMPDGTAAVGARVVSLPATEEQPASAVTDSAGQFALRDTFSNGAQIQASSSDQVYQAILKVSAVATRRVLAAPVELKLEPAVLHEVSVRTEDEKPVEGAHVMLRASSAHAMSVTGPDGEAILRFPARCSPDHIAAWHPTLGVAGILDLDKRPATQVTQLILQAPSTHTIHVVDPSDHPVADVELAVSTRTQDSQWVVTKEIAPAHARTDSAGTATLPWVPKDELQYVDVDVFNAAWKVDEIDRDRIAQGHTTVRVRRELPVTGRLVMPRGASAEGILISGFGFGPGHSGDIPYARARRDGSFTMRVPSDHGYVLGITDLEWASDPWSGLILTGGNDKQAEVSMAVYPATPVSFRVTRGTDRRPVADAWVQVEAEGEVELTDANGEKHTGRAGVGGWLTTDANGMARTGLGHGKHEFRLSSGIWSEERTMEITSAEPINIEFHRAWSGNRKLTGCLMVDGAAYKPSAELKKFAWAKQGDYQPLVFEPKLQPDGTFSVDFDAETLELLLIDAEQERAGYCVVGLEQSQVDLAMKPTATYEGVLLDAESKQPMPGRELRLRPASSWDAIVGTNTTDDTGRFRFVGLPSEMPLDVYCISTDEKSHAYIPGRERFFQPGEVRTEQRLFVETIGSSKPRPEPPTPLLEVLAKSCRDARLSRMGVLVILPGDNSPTLTNLVNEITGGEKTEEVYWYRVIPVDRDARSRHAEAIKNLGWTVPEGDQLVMLALDGEQKMLGKVRLRTDESAMALKEAIEFLKAHKPATADAVALVDDARQRAKSSGRRVWLIEGGPRCGPCFSLSRWMDDHHDVLEKDYIIVKLMAGLDQNLQNALRPFSGKGSGIPWHAITEPDGTVLATSDGPVGNIGMPSTVEEIRHMRSMLERTATRLTSREIDDLVHSLSQ